MRCGVLRSDRNERSDISVSDCIQNQGVRNEGGREDTQTRASGGSFGSKARQE